MVSEIDDISGYCTGCGKERKFQHIQTIPRKDGSEVEVYRCPICGNERRFVTG